MRTFEITGSSHSVEVAAGGAVEVAFTVTSKAERPLTGRTEVRVAGEVDRRWITTTPERPRFSANGTERVTVKVAVPKEMAQGEHELRLVVASEEHPDDDWAESAPVTLSVRRSESKKDGFPWWIVAVAGAALIMAIGGLIAWKLMQKPGFLDPCQPGECAAGLVCTAVDAERLCLRDLGEPCDDDTMCASLFCRAGLCAHYSGRCAEDADCREGEGCRGNRCVPALEAVEVTVVLEAIGPSKIQVIKVVREVTGLGLKESKELVERAPTAVVEGVSKAEAREIVAKLREAGAEVGVE